MAEEMQARDSKMNYDSLRTIGDEVCNFADGGRSVNQIAEAIGAEFDFEVKRSHGWVDNWCRLVVRYDWYTQSYVAFLTIACFMTILSRILG